MSTLCFTTPALLLIQEEPTHSVQNLTAKVSIYLIFFNKTFCGAGAVGFEPTDVLPSPVFKTGAFVRSAMPPESRRALPCVPRISVSRETDCQGSYRGHCSERVIAGHAGRRCLLSAPPPSRRRCCSRRPGAMRRRAWISRQAPSPGRGGGRRPARPGRRG